MVGQKKQTIFRSLTPKHHDTGKCSIGQNDLLFIRSKTGILNVTIFKYSDKL